MTKCTVLTKCLMFVQFPVDHNDDEDKVEQDCNRWKDDGQEEEACAVALMVSGEVQGQIQGHVYDADHPSNVGSNDELLYQWPSTRLERVRHGSVPQVCILPWSRLA